MVSELQPKTDFVPAEVFLVDDLETLKVLADPLRLRLRELMEKPTTVKRVAEKLDMLPTKLYYHINLLEKHGLIVLVDTRVVSGIIEKHYQIAAKSVRVAKHLLSTGTDPEGEGLNLTIGTLLETTREELMESARAGMVEWDDEGERHKGISFHMGTLNLTDEQAADFYHEVESLLERYHDLSDEQQDKNGEHLKSYRALYLLFPKKIQTPDKDQ
jgi:DNA-binding transcriptional ArsR family regulator